MRLTSERRVFQHFPSASSLLGQLNNLITPHRCNRHPKEVQNHRFAAFKTMLLSLKIPLPISCISRPFLLGCNVFRQIPANYSPLGKMSRSKNGTKISQAESLSIGGNSAIHNNSVMAERSLLNTSSHDKDSIMVGSIPIPIFQKKQHMKYSQSLPERRNSSNKNNPGLMSMPDPVTSSLNTAVSEYAQFNRRTRVDLGSKKASINTCHLPSFSCHTESNNSSCTERLLAVNFTENIDESSLPDQFGKKRKVASPSTPNVPAGKTDSSVSLPKFDICWHVRANSAFRGESPPAGNKECCTELPERGATQMILRPGMVLLKHYINHNEQVKIVKNCRELGLGPGGFYQPGYKDGAKLRLQMMCLGLDWDPQTRKYENTRQIDGMKPPKIPGQFNFLVKRAIQDAHSLIKKESGVSNVEDILPSLSPNICIVNFYTTNGKLGLHQDRDESRESLRKGLPVVSFSIGDSAEFLYGDQRDVEEADKVLLESGDVLIFGGKSRHVFHGVSSIIPNSAPKLLLNDTRLRHGRLNLTFRQF